MQKTISGREKCLLYSSRNELILIQLQDYTGQKGVKGIFFLWYFQAMLETVPRQYMIALADVRILFGLVGKEFVMGYTVPLPPDTLA